MRTLIDLFKEFAPRGDKTAFIYRTGVRRFSYSYGALHDLSLRMNSLLSRLGVGRGDRVLIWGPNSPEWGVAFWGIVARGGVAAPVDFMCDLERAGSIARLTEAKLVIQSRFKTERLTGYPSIYMEDLLGLLSSSEPLESAASPSPEDIAQIIYTSGSTGNPKGVILTHGNLIANLLQVNAHIPIVAPSFRFLSLLPLSHMFEQMGGFLTPLYRGGAVVYMRALKPSAIMDALGEEDIYAIIAVPRLLQLLKTSIERELDSRGLGAPFRTILTVAEKFPQGMRKRLFYPVQRKFGRHFTLFISGGAPLDPELFRFWSAMGFTILEGYGLTECGPVLSANTMERQAPGSVGAPLPGVHIRIKENQVLARGDNVFPGYYGDHEATSEAFTADGWFLTGDLGEMDETGFLRIRGRKKELIVTGAGVNVYPDDVENVLNRVAGVRESCVIGLDRGGGEEVHAVLLLDGSGRSGDGIVREANRGLDALARITGFSIWPDREFPKTTTMKIRKFKVKEQLVAGLAGEEGGIAGDRLINLIAQVTGRQRGEIGEEAFLVSNLGLTSIARLELVNALEQEYRLDLEDSLIGPQTRVGELRRMIERRERPTQQEHFRFWTNSALLRLMRMVFDLLLHYPLTRLFINLHIKGEENLASLKGPLLFISNHISYLDQPAIMFALPRRLRYRTATAAWAEFFFENYKNPFQRAWKRFTYEYGAFALNLFPLPQSGGFRGSLRFMGRLADHGVNILVFPEGERSVTGALLPFRQGLGVMVKELSVPVVPVRISGMERVLPREAYWPERGCVTVAFGKPLVFKDETVEEIVNKARLALLEL